MRVQGRGVCSALWLLGWWGEGREQRRQQQRSGSGSVAGHKWQKRDGRRKGNGKAGQGESMVKVDRSGTVEGGHTVAEGGGGLLC